MRNIFRLIEQSPIISANKTSQGVFSLAGFLNGPKATKQVIPDIIEDEDKDGLNVRASDSRLSTQETAFQSRVNAFEFGRTDFDFIKSDHVHICLLSDSEFKDGVVDLVNMQECVSVVVEDEEMLFWDTI